MSNAAHHQSSLIHINFEVDIGNTIRDEWLKLMFVQRDECSFREWCPTLARSPKLCA